MQFRISLLLYLPLEQIKSKMLFSEVTWNNCFLWYLSIWYIVRLFYFVFNACMVIFQFATVFWICKTFPKPKWYTIYIQRGLSFLFCKDKQIHTFMYICICVYVCMCVYLCFPNTAVTEKISVLFIPCFLHWTKYPTKYLYRD